MLCARCLCFASARVVDCGYKTNRKEHLTRHLRLQHDQEPEVAPIFAGASACTRPFSEVRFSALVNRSGQLRTEPSVRGQARNTKAARTLAVAKSKGGVAKRVRAGKSVRQSPGLGLALVGVALMQTLCVNPTHDAAGMSLVGFHVAAPVHASVAIVSVL